MRRPLGCALALTVLGVVGPREAVAQPRLPDAAALRATAARLLDAQPTAKRRPPSVRRQAADRTLRWSLGAVPLPTELTAASPLAVLLQTQMEIEHLRRWTSEDVLRELWWSRPLKSADAEVAFALEGLRTRRERRGAALDRVLAARARVRGEILVEHLRQLLPVLDRDEPGDTAWRLEAAADAAYANFVRVRVRVSVPGATVRYASEWDWELWTMLGEDPREHLSVLPLGEPVLLDGRYFFEVKPADGSAPTLIGPREVVPANGDLTLP